MGYAGGGGGGGGGRGGGGGGANAHRADAYVPSRSESEADQAERQSPMKNSKLTKDQRREIRKKAQKTEKSWEGSNSEYPDITIEDLKKLQAEDPTLAEVIRTADRSANDRNESVAVPDPGIGSGGGGGGGEGVAWVGRSRRRSRPGEGAAQLGGLGERCKLEPQKPTLFALKPPKST